MAILTAPVISLSGQPGAPNTACASIGHVHLTVRNPEEHKKLWQLIRADKPLTKKFQDEVIKANQPPGTPTGSPSPGTPSPSADAGPKADEKAAEAAANGLCA